MATLNATEPAELFADGTLARAIGPTLRQLFHRHGGRQHPVTVEHRVGGPLVDTDAQPSSGAGSKPYLSKIACR
ncbi:hypothetical protein NKG94_16635 [Micromonospora sp. M12]